MATDNLAALYDHYNKLDAAKENISQFESSYLAILNSVQGTSQEKQLCSQFITKFFVHFPAHYEAAIDALLDLCEDEDVNIRRRAIKELPSICKDRNEFVGKIADVLAQLLLSEDQVELTIVNHSLTTLANYDIKSFFSTLFNDILEGEEEIRDRVIKFLKDRFKLIHQNLFTKEVEEFILEESKKVLVDVTKEEFIVLMNILAGLKISKTLTGHNVLLSIIAEKAELNSPFNVSDTDFLDKLLMCIRHGSPYFSQFSPSTDFVLYLITKVLIHYPKLEESQNVNELEILQGLAEIVPYISPTLETETIKQCQSQIYSLLLKFLPLPPEDVSAVLNAEELPVTQFSHIECLLYSFHQLCKFNPNYFSSENMIDTLKDFKLRLQYLSRVVQVYINKLKKSISLSKPGELKLEDNKIKTIALNATTNINTLIRDFFKIPPSYKSAIPLSFKTQAKQKLPSGNTLKQALSVASPKVTPVTITVPDATVGVVGDDAVKEGENGAKKRKPILPPDEVDPPKKAERLQASRAYGGGGYAAGGRVSQGGYKAGGRPKWNGPSSKRARW